MAVFWMIFWKAAIISWSGKKPETAKALYYFAEIVYNSLWWKNSRIREGVWISVIKKTKDREESIFAEIHPAEQNTGKNTGIVQPLPHPITAPVNKIIPFSCVDGFGNRTAIFFQGCNQDCLYCHNPETIHLCKNCGACVNACPAQALSLVDGKVVYDKDCCCNCDTCLSVCDHCASPKICWISAKTLYQQVKDYFPFIDGITTSGGVQFIPGFSSGILFHG